MPGFVFSYCDIPVPLIISALGIATTIRITIRPLDRGWLAEFNRGMPYLPFGEIGGVTRQCDTDMTSSITNVEETMRNVTAFYISISGRSYRDFFSRWTNTRTFGASQQNFGRLDNTSQWWPNSEKRIQELTNSAMPGECRYGRSYRMHSMLRLGCCPRFHSKYSQIMLERTSIAPWNGKWEFS